MVALPESNSMLQYAADKVGNDAAYPRDPQTRADINRWLQWEGSHWFPSCYVFLVENTPDNPRRPEQALPALLRDQGVSLSLIGFTSALALPWALKFLWAPLIDRYGTRKRWLLGLNGLTMALMLLVASRDFAAWVERLPWLLAVLFCANVISATQDIATDGYAVTKLKPELRGLGNSIQVIGYKIGMVMGSGGLLWLVSQHGWQASYGGLACLMLLVIVPVLFMQDERTPRQQAATHTTSTFRAFTAAMS